MTAALFPLLAPAATPTPASPVAVPSPPAPAHPGTEKQPRRGAAGDPSPSPAAVEVAPLRPAVGGGLPWVSGLRRACMVCGAEPGVFCHPVGGERAVIVHRGRL